MKYWLLVRKKNTIICLHWEAGTNLKNRGQTNDGVFVWNNGFSVTARWILQTVRRKTVCKPSLARDSSIGSSGSNRTIRSLPCHISINNYLLIIEGTMVYETASLDKTLHHWVIMISISEQGENAVPRLARNIIIFCHLFGTWFKRLLQEDPWLLNAGTVLGRKSKN